MGFCLMGLMGSLGPCVLPLSLLQYFLLFFTLKTKFHFLSFPFIFLFLFFLYRTLVSAGSTYIASFLQLQFQIPSNCASSPFAHEKVWFHLPFNTGCTLFCPLLQSTHDMWNVFHFNRYNVRMILFYLSRKGLNAGIGMCIYTQTQWNCSLVY